MQPTYIGQLDKRTANLRGYCRDDGGKVWVVRVQFLGKSNPSNLFTLQSNVQAFIKRTFPAQDDTQAAVEMIGTRTPTPPREATDTHTPMSRHGHPHPHVKPHHHHTQNARNSGLVGKD